MKLKKQNLNAFVNRKIDLCWNCLLILKEDLKIQYDNTINNKYEAINIILSVKLVFKLISESAP